MPRQALKTLHEQDGATNHDTSSEQEDLLTIREVAQRLRVDTTTVRRWISLGLLDAIILPHRGKRQAYRVRRRTLDQLLQSGQPLIEPGAPE